jgi:hypothetical protein
MRLEKYDSRQYPALSVAARQVGASSLLNKDFVDYYYLAQPWSELHLAFDEDGSCAAFIGWERLRFEQNGQEVPIGFATNFFTLKPGMGGFLWLQWMKSCSFGLVFGGSEHTHQIVRKQNFTYYPGMHVYTMNGRYSMYPGEPVWRNTLKRVLRHFVRRQLRSYKTRGFERESASITLEEIRSCNASRIEANCFRFRFAPKEDYLRWRYNSELGFVRYRWFNIFEQTKRVGYCVINDAPVQVIVAHSDGIDPEKLAYGILKAVFRVAENDEKKRTALLVSSHPAMQEIFTRYGFELDADRPMAIGSLRAKPNLEDPQHWLINFGLGDNDLRSFTFQSKR